MYLKYLCSLAIREMQINTRTWNIKMEMEKELYSVLVGYKKSGALDDWKEYKLL